MPRRDFLKLLSLGPLHHVSGCAPLAAAAPAPRAAPATGPSRSRPSSIRGICFDLFTLFDPRSVVAVAQDVVGDEAEALCAAWRVRQFEYSWLRVAAHKYEDFRLVTAEALSYAAAAQNLRLSPASSKRLIDAYSQLSLWPDSRAQLVAWKQAGLKLAPLANYSPSMLDSLIANAGIAPLFDTLISTDAAKTFKPDPAAYALGPARLGLEPDAIAFAAFGGWDAAGAKWFGFHSFWVNRLAVAPETVRPPPDGTGPTLTELATFVGA